MPSLTARIRRSVFSSAPKSKPSPLREVTNDAAFHMETEATKVVSVVRE